MAATGQGRAALAEYRRIRPAIRRVTGAGLACCNRADMVRSVKQVAPWADAGLLEQEADSFADIALFELNQRGRRAYDRFLAGPAAALSASDRALAERMAAAWFSLFRVADPHPEAGLWLEDMLDADRRIWLMDESLRASATAGLIIGLRVFDAGPFHCGFGIVTRPDEDTVVLCLAAVSRGVRSPFRHSLAATLYGDRLLDMAGPGSAGIELLDVLREIIARAPTPRRPRK